MLWELRRWREGVPARIVIAQSPHTVTVRFTLELAADPAAIRASSVGISSKVAFSTALDANAAAEYDGEFVERLAIVQRANDITYTVEARHSATLQPLLHCSLYFDPPWTV